MLGEYAGRIEGGQQSWYQDEADSGKVWKTVVVSKDHARLAYVASGEDDPRDVFTRMEKYRELQEGRCATLIESGVRTRSARPTRHPAQCFEGHSSLTMKDCPQCF